MNQEITKELAKKLIEIKGECRGIHLKSDGEYILMQEGNEGLKRVEKELTRLGFPINYEKVKNLEFYPAGLRAISLLAAKKIFNWNDEDMRRMCGYAEASFIIRLYLKYFSSVPKVLEQASNIWREYWSEGRLVVKDYNEKERYVIVRIEDFDLHPVYCRCMEGYLENFAKMVVISKKTSCRETECFFSGGKGHEFLLKY